jgi:hypothetical protein
MADMDGWPVYLWAGALLLSILAAGVTAASGRAPRRELPATHVAGATLIGLLGWWTLIQLPGLIRGYLDLTAGLGRVEGIEPHQLFVIGQIAFAIASGFAVFGILRRARWGAVLGIGLAAALLIWNVAIQVHNWSLYGDSYPDGLVLELVLDALGAQVGAAIAAIVLLAWPVPRTDEGPASEVAPA